MDIAEQVVDGSLVLAPKIRRLDASVAISFKEDVWTRCSAGGSRLVLDLGSVDYMDSSGLGALVALLKRAGPGRSLSLARIQPPVARLLAMTRLDQVFQIFASVEEATGKSGAA